LRVPFPTATVWLRQRPVSVAARALSRHDTALTPTRLKDQGLNVENDDDTIVGNVDALHDFARSHDVAGVVNAVATHLLLDDVHARLISGIEDDGASLDDFHVAPAAGWFQVSGTASKSSGAVHFSFQVVPIMYHTQPGTVFRYLPTTRWVNSRTWAALDYRIEGVHTDVDRSWWVIVLEVFFGVLTVGLAVLYVEDLASAAAANFSGRVSAARPGAPAARIRRTIPPPGGVAVRIGMEAFEITPDGTYIGISVREKPSPMLLGRDRGDRTRHPVADPDPARGVAARRVRPLALSGAQPADHGGRGERGVDLPRRDAGASLVGMAPYRRAVSRRPRPEPVPLRPGDGGSAAVPAAPAGEPSQGVVPVLLLRRPRGSEPCPVSVATRLDPSACPRWLCRSRAAH